jgi:hypothetical protein
VENVEKLVFGKRRNGVILNAAIIFHEFLGNNFNIRSATAEEAEELGRAWVGDEATSF